MMITGFWDTGDAAASLNCYRVMSGEAPDHQRSTVVVGFVDLSTARSIQLTFSKRPQAMPWDAQPAPSTGVTWLWSWAFEGDGCWPIASDGAALLQQRKPSRWKARPSTCMNDLLLPVKAIVPGNLGESAKLLREKGHVEAKVNGYRGALTIKVESVHGLGLELDIQPSTEHRRILISPARVDEENIIPREWPPVVAMSPDENRSASKHVREIESWEDVAMHARTVFPRGLSG